MSGNKYDPLEKFFRSRLDNPKPATDDWNVPPDFLLDNALESIQTQKKSKRRILFWWFFGVIMIFVLFSLIINNSRQIDQLNNTLEEFQADHYKTGITPSNEKVFQIVEPHDKNMESVNNKMPVTVDQISGNSKGVANFKSDLTNESGHISEVKTSADNAQLLNQNTAGHLTPIKEIKQDVEAPVRRIGEVRSIRLLTHGLEETDIAVPPLLQNFEIDKHNRSLKSQFRLTSAYHLSSMCMTNTENAEFSLVGYEKNYSGYRIGIEYVLPLNEKLRILTQGSFNKIRNESQYYHELAYDKAKETVNSQLEREYKSIIDIETPMGSFSDDVQFKLGNTDIPNDDILTNDSAIKQHLDILNVSSGIEYTLLSAGNLKVTFGGGLGANYIIDHSSDMEMTLKYFDTLLTEASFNEESVRNTNKVFMSWHGTLGLQYALNDKLNLTLRSGYERSLTSLRTVHSGLDSETYLRSITLGLGIGYMF